MSYYIYNGELYDASELYHHGILGQKWGVRRFQNKDGTLTAAGRNRIKSQKAQTAGSKKENKLKRFSFDSTGQAKADFGNNSECIAVLDPGGNEQTANKVLNSSSVEKRFRQYAADRLYILYSLEHPNASFDEYKKKIICQQINFGGFKDDPMFDSGKTYDVTCWYGEDPDGSGEMMYYNSKTNEIISSQFYR